MIPLLVLASAAPAVCNRGPIITRPVVAHVSHSEETQLENGRVVAVEVTLDRTGRVSSAKVYSTSGLAAADAAALEAARASGYSPALKNCTPVAKTVVFDEVVRPDYAFLAQHCSTPFQNATALQAASPNYPASAARLRAQGEAVVEVRIGPSGELEEAHIVTSANNMALDQAALDAARRTIYSPKTVHCVPTTGIYLFKVTFRANGIP